SARAGRTARRPRQRRTGARFHHGAGSSNRREIRAFDAAHKEHSSCRRKQQIIIARSSQYSLLLRAGNLLALQMAKFDFGLPADLFPARSAKGGRPARYRRFDTAAQAVRYAIEEMPQSYLVGAVLQAGDERIDGSDIRELYDSVD